MCQYYMLSTVYTSTVAKLRTSKHNYTYGLRSSCLKNYYSQYYLLFKFKTFLK